MVLSTSPVFLTSQAFLSKRYPPELGLPSHNFPWTACVAPTDFMVQWYSSNSCQLLILALSSKLLRICASSSALGQGCQPHACRHTYSSLQFKARISSLNNSEGTYFFFFFLILWFCGLCHGCVFGNSAAQEEKDWDRTPKCKETCNVSLVELNAFEE